MTDALTHRSLAAQTYNATWELLEASRTPEQDRELLCIAMASRYHWSQEGGQQQQAVADWMVSRCFAAVGEGQLALSFAGAALHGMPEDAPPWLRASLLEGMARALSAAGNVRARDGHLARARKELEAETDQENRALIESQIDGVP